MNRKRIQHSVEIVERLLELGRFAYGDMPETPTLTRTQWAALHYFARANEYSRTASAFGAFHATTPGTVSETIAGLVRRGLLRRRRSKADRRTVHLDLTEQGWTTLASDPSCTLEKAVERLPAEQAMAVADGLATLAAAVAREQQRPTFGICDRCKYFETEGEGAEEGARREGCRLLKMAIDPDDAAALCVGFEGR